MRRLLTLLSVLMVASILLAACGTPATEAPAEPAPAEPAAPAEPEPAAPTEEPGTTEGPAPAAQGGGILEAVKARGKLVCGGRTDLAGFGMLDDAGNNIGFDIDVCRAIAAAVLGDPECG